MNGTLPTIIAATALVASLLAACARPMPPADRTPQAPASATAVWNPGPLRRCSDAGPDTELAHRPPRDEPPACPGAPGSLDVARWVSVPVYPPGSEKLLCANHSRCEWTLSREGKRILATSAGPEREATRLPFCFEPDEHRGMLGRPLVVAVSDGFLAGYDGGEFGAALWWFNGDGSKARLVLGGAHVRSFLKTEGDLLAIESYGGRSASRGSIFRLARDDSNHWEAREIARLPSATRGGRATILEPDSAILVAMDSGIARVTVTGEVTILHQARWGLVSPSSIVRGDDGAMFVGLRYAVARISPTANGTREEWFVPPECAELVKGEGLGAECRCRGAGDGGAEPGSAVLP